MTSQPEVVRAAVIVASTRAAAGTYEDLTGPLIVQWLRDRGVVTDAVVVADGESVGEALRRAVIHADLVITTGGTGLTPTDRTPEQTAPVLDYQLPGLAEKIRASGGDAVPTSILSRALAGVAGRTLIVNLPGSRGGVRDGLAVLDPVWRHAVAQLRGEGAHD